jgi:hypothetical protein
MNLILKRIFVAYAIMLVAFTLLIIGVHCIPRSAIAQNVEESVNVMEQEGTYKRILNTEFFQLDNFTDCYMMNLIYTTDSRKPVEAAMMNYRYMRNNSSDIIHSTQDLIAGDTEDLSVSTYGRYWHGYQVFLKPLLTIMSYKAIRIVNYIFLISLLCYSSFLIWKKVRKSAGIIFILLLMLINFPMIPLSLQFSTCFYISFVAIILLLRNKAFTKDSKNLLTFFFVVGGVTSYLDFLTTPQLTLGLPMIVYLMSSDKTDKWKWVIYLSIAWSFGYASLWASKWAMTYLLTGNNILDSVARNINLHTSDVVGVRHISLYYVFKSAKRIILHRHQVRSIIVIATIIFLILIWLKAVKNRKAVFDNAYMLLIALIVPIWWFGLLRHHSLHHYSFTWRAGLLILYSMTLFIYNTTSWKNLIKIRRK